MTEQTTAAQEQDSKPADGKSVLNGGLGKLTKAQQKCLAKLLSVEACNGWVYNHCDNIGFQQRVLDALVARGLVERDRGSYRAVPNIKLTSGALDAPETE